MKFSLNNVAHEIKSKSPVLLDILLDHCSSSFIIMIEQAAQPNNKTNKQLPFLRPMRTQAHEHRTHTTQQLVLHAPGLQLASSICYLGAIATLLLVAPLLVPCVQAPPSITS